MDAAMINELLDGVPEKLATELRAKLEKEGSLVKTWCQCDPPCDFRCYPGDDECSCGMRKHHVHGVCGGVLQIG